MKALKVKFPTRRDSIAKLIAAYPYLKRQTDLLKLYAEMLKCGDVELERGIDAWIRSNKNAPSVSELIEVVEIASREWRAKKLEGLKRYAILDENSEYYGIEEYKKLQQYFEDNDCPFLAQSVKLRIKVMFEGEERNVL